MEYNGFIPSKAGVRRGSVPRYFARGNNVGSAASARGPPGKISYPIRYRAAPLPEDSAIVFQNGELSFFSFFPLRAVKALISVMLDTVSLYIL